MIKVLGLFNDPEIAVNVDEESDASKLIWLRYPGDDELEDEQLEQPKFEYEGCDWGVGVVVKLTRVGDTITVSTKYGGTPYDDDDSLEGLAAQQEFRDNNDVVEVHEE